MSRIITQRLSFQLLLVIGFLCLITAPVQAATFTVNSTVDAVDANTGDGVCETAPANGECTLPAAVQESNALASADAINLPAGTYTLSVAGRGENQAATGDLDIKGNLTITGANAASTIIDGGQIDRIFDINFASISVTLTGMTLQNGAAQGSSSDAGGAISHFANSGTLTSSNANVSSNTAALQGGGIFHLGVR